MRMSPCCNREELKKGSWIQEEDEKLKAYVEKHGPQNWRTLPEKAGLNRDGKSCRLRWTNYLRPDIKRGNFSDEEEGLIIRLHSSHGNKWSLIAQQLPGRTDNEIKNYWNTHIRKKLRRKGIDPVTHCPCHNPDSLKLLPNLLTAAASINLDNLLMPNSLNSYLTLMDNWNQLAKIQLQNLLQSTQPNLFNPYILSLLANSSLQSNQSSDTSQYSHFSNEGMNARETSNLSFLQSMAFDPNSGCSTQNQVNQPYSLTTSSNNDSSIWDKQFGSSYVADDYSIPPLVSVSPYDMAATQIYPSTSRSTISAVNSSSSSAMNSIVGSLCEPWDLNQFLESNNEDTCWKDILERISSSCKSSTPYQDKGEAERSK